jgi:hypothetical protein
MLYSFCSADRDVNRAGEDSLFSSTTMMACHRLHTSEQRLLVARLTPLLADFYENGLNIDELTLNFILYRLTND